MTPDNLANHTVTVVEFITWGLIIAGAGVSWGFQKADNVALARRVKALEDRPVGVPREECNRVHDTLAEDMREVVRQVGKTRSDVGDMRADVAAIKGALGIEHKPRTLGEHHDDLHS